MKQTVTEPSVRWKVTGSEMKSTPFALQLHDVDQDVRLAGDLQPGRGAGRAGQAEHRVDRRHGQVMLLDLDQAELADVEIQRPLSIGHRYRDVIQCSNLHESPP